MKKKAIVLLCCAVLAFSLAGCGSDNREQKLTQAKEQAGVFESGDINDINNLFFPESNIQITDALPDGFKSDAPADSHQGSGVLGEIFSLNTVLVSDVNENGITFEITAPDLSSFFEDCSEQLATVSAESELADLLLEYADGADTKQSFVTLEYEYKEGLLIVDYQNQDFIDAMTGGLVTAYSALYQRALEDYREALGQ